jgi:hypothetical protein
MCLFCLSACSYFRFGTPGVEAFSAVRLLRSGRLCARETLASDLVAYDFRDHAVSVFGVGGWRDNSGQLTEAGAEVLL